MQRFISFSLFLISLVLYIGCAKDNFDNGGGNNNGQTKDTVKANTTLLPDSVVYRAQLFKNATPKIFDITFEGDSAGYYATVYHVSDTNIVAPIEQAEINDYEAKNLDSLYIKANEIIFFNQPYSYYCLGQVFKVDYKIRSIWFVM